MSQLNICPAMICTFKCRRGTSGCIRCLAQARNLRLAKASQGCLAFAVVHSREGGRKRWRDGRGAASKNRSGHFEPLLSGLKRRRARGPIENLRASCPEIPRNRRQRVGFLAGTQSPRAGEAVGEGRDPWFSAGTIGVPSGSGFACGAKPNLKPPGSAFVGSMAAMVLGRRPSLAA